MYKSLERDRHILNSFASESPTPPRSYRSGVVQWCGCGPGAPSPLVCKGSGHGLYVTNAAARVCAETHATPSRPVPAERLLAGWTLEVVETVL